MRGLIFTTLLDMLEEKYGIQAVNDILDTCDFEHGGAFTSGRDYPDDEIEALLKNIEKKTGIDRETALHSFGLYMFANLKVKFNAMIVSFKQAKELLLNVDEVIHHEVVKLYPQKEFVVFKYEDTGPDTLTMVYKSERKMCSLAEGLIEGVGKHFATDIEIDHQQCMLTGSDNCRLELRFQND